MKHYVLATQQEWGVEVFRRCPVGFICVNGSSSDDNFRDIVWALKPRYVFFLNWSAYVPSSILTLSEAVNFHAFGPAPGVWHRGGGPIENLILLGYTETMIWAHQMVEEVDAGDVYASRGPISLAGTKAQILDRFIDPVVELVRWIITEEPEPYPQVGEVVMFKRLPKAEYNAFWKARV